MVAFRDDVLQLCTYFPSDVRLHGSQLFGTTASPVHTQFTSDENTKDAMAVVYEWSVREIGDRTAERSRCRRHDGGT